jgi:ribosomal protein S18 acetylase RimI-like enzyme
MTDRPYPESVSGPFESPPLELEDREGRPVSIEVFDGDRDALVEMYADFDPADRAQGIPPVGEDRIRDWLEHLLCENCYNVVASHDGDVVGHATLVGDDQGGYELAIFVHQEFQGAGVGTELLESLLGYGAEQGIDRVWLTVERWNRPAINLYRKVGFETTDAQSFEHEMSIRLRDHE